MISKVEEFSCLLKRSKRAHAASPFWFHSEMQNGGLDDNVFFRDEGQYPVSSLQCLNPQTFPLKQGGTAGRSAGLRPAHSKENFEFTEGAIH
jgi:hypothetical protein